MMENKHDPQQQKQKYSKPHITNEDSSSNFPERSFSEKKKINKKHSREGFGKTAIQSVGRNLQKRSLTAVKLIQMLRTVNNLEWGGFGTEKQHKLLARCLGGARI